VDPVIVFGEGAAQVGGDHKDTWIRSDQGPRAHGADVLIACEALPIRQIDSLMRFSFIGHIPASAAIYSAILTLVTDRICPGLMTITMSRLVTNWGVTLVDEGISQNPAALGQATWDNAFDWNNPLIDTGWAAGLGVGFGAGDFGAPAANFVIPNAAAANTAFNCDITAGVALDIINDATQYGHTLANDINALIGFHSSRAVVVANRWYLTVTYAETPIGASKIHIPIGIGI